MASASTAFPRVLGQEPAHGAGQGDGGGGAREPEAGQRGQSVPRAREGGVGVDHDLRFESVGEARDALTEASFLNTYGSPFVQAVAGLNAEPTAAPRHIEREVERERAASRASLSARASIRDRRCGRGRASRADLHPQAGRLDRRARVPDAEDHPRLEEGEQAADAFASSRPC